MVKETKKTNKKAQKKTENKVQKKGIFKRIGEWFKSLWKEVTKVRWTSKKEMVKYSIATILFVVFFGLFFYAIELVMAFIKSLI